MKRIIHPFGTRNKYTNLPTSISEQIAKHAVNGTKIEDITVFYFCRENDNVKVIRDKATNVEEAK